MSSIKSRLRTIARTRSSVVVTVASLIATFATASALIPSRGEWPSKFAGASALSGPARPIPNQQIRVKQNVALGAPFTSGNLVVYRVGDGSAPLSANAAAVFVDEYTPAGVLVQSITLPTAVNGSNKRLT